MLTHISLSESKSKAGEVRITKVIGNNNARARKKRNLKLSSSEENHINSNNILSEESTDLTQQLLGNQFPYFAGFGNITLTEQNGLDVINAAKSFIETLHTGAARCICAANLKRSRPQTYCCKVCDNLNSGNMTVKVADKVVNLLYCRKSEISYT